MSLGSTWRDFLAGADESAFRPEVLLQGHQRPGRDGPQTSAGAVRCVYAAAAANKRLLCRWREGERAVLRPQAAVGAPVDRQAVDLRLQDEPELHPEDPRPRTCPYDKLMGTEASTVSWLPKRSWWCGR